MDKAKEVVLAISATGTEWVTDAMLSAAIPDNPSERLRDAFLSTKEVFRAILAAVVTAGSVDVMALRMYVRALHDLRPGNADNRRFSDDHLADLKAFHKARGDQAVRAFCERAGLKPEDVDKRTDVPHYSTFSQARSKAASIVFKGDKAHTVSWAKILDAAGLDENLQPNDNGSSVKVRALYERAKGGGGKGEKDKPAVTVAEVLEMVAGTSDYFRINAALQILRDVDGLDDVVQALQHWTEDDANIPATDAARDLAAENGLDLSEIDGTGAGGRIIKRDVQAAVQAAA